MLYSVLLLQSPIVFLVHSYPHLSHVSANTLTHEIKGLVLVKLLVLLSMKKESIGYVFRQTFGSFLPHTLSYFV